VAGPDNPPVAPARAEMGGDAALLVVGRMSHEASAICRRAEDLLETSGARTLLCDVASLRRPDAAAVDTLARLQLLATRLGCRLVLLRVPGELGELLDLAGLNEVIDLSGVESLWETEQREEMSRVEKERDP
jgi:anti-anti-sigma regulatory factor